MAKHHVRGVAAWGPGWHALKFVLCGWCSLGCPGWQVLAPAANDHLVDRCNFFILQEARHLANLTAAIALHHDAIVMLDLFDDACCDAFIMCTCRYGVSKLCCSSYSRVLAKQLEPQGVMVNACCPGWCQTDMSSMSGNKSAAQGADTPVWLALRAPNDFATGGFYQERQQLPF